MRKIFIKFSGFNFNIYSALVHFNTFTIYYARRDENYIILYVKLKKKINLLYPRKLLKKLLEPGFRYDSFALMNCSVELEKHMLVGIVC